jgi:hypothetical protein
MAFARRGRNLVQAPNNLSTLHKGDEVFLASGLYEGTLAIFLNLGVNSKWAEIYGANGDTG